MSKEEAVVLMGEAMFERFVQEFKELWRELFPNRQASEIGVSAEYVQTHVRELLAPSKTPLPAFLEDFCKFLSTILRENPMPLTYPFYGCSSAPYAPRLSTAVASIRGRERERSGPWRTR